MKRLAFVLSAILITAALASAAAAQFTGYTNLLAATGKKASVEIAANQMVRIVSVRFGATNSLLNFQFGNQAVAIAGDENKATGFILTGPVRVDLESANNGGASVAMLEILPLQAPVQPSTAVVIPSDATGPVEIVLESSPDLISWFAAQPGMYGATATNRFFRVRAVRK